MKSQNNRIYLLFSKHQANFARYEKWYVYRTLALSIYLFFSLFTTFPQFHTCQSYSFKAYNNDNRVQKLHVSDTISTSNLFDFCLACKWLKLVKSLEKNKTVTTFSTVDSFFQPVLNNSIFSNFPTTNYYLRAPPNVS